MGIEDAFLQDILAHPDDDAPRLIYADWLEEHDNPRGEFIRVQCALARLDEEDPRRWPLERRAEELLREHEKKWLSHGVVAGLWTFRRGFVEQITLTPDEFLFSADRLFEQAPIQYLRLRQREGSVDTAEGDPNSLLARVARSPLLARLTGLSLARPLSRHDLQAFADSPHLRRLTELRLSGLYLDEDVLFEWGESPHLPNLRRLDVSESHLSSRVIRAMAETPRLAALTALNLALTVNLSLEDLRVLARSSSLTRLTELNLSGNGVNRHGLTHAAVGILGEGPLLRQLETLYLDANALGDPGALAVRDWPALPRLRRLTLRHNHMHTTGIQALAEAPALSELVSLDLFGNISCDAGAAALAFSSCCAKLRTLNLRFNGVGDDGVRAIAQSRKLSDLTWLNLTANRVTSRGAQALIDSPYLTRLARLELLRNDIGAKERQGLRERFGPFVDC
jgi:uncharacterized protein (TIGR02996 family)